MKQLILSAVLLSTVASPAMAAKIIPATPAPTTASTKPAAAVAASAPAPTVFAAVTPVAVQPPPPAAAPVKPAPVTSSRSAFYVGASVGDSTIGVLMGYQISKMYAMELEYDYVDPIDTVEASGGTTRLAKSRVGISGLALFPIKFSDMGPMAIYIKAGYAGTSEKYTVNDPGIPGFPAFPATTTVTTTVTTGVTGGAGVQVDLSNNSTARLGINYVGGDRSVYLAALYKF